MGVEYKDVWRQIERDDLARQLVVADRRLLEANERIAQLEQALASRIVIEQAKGVLAERLSVSVGEAFAILRYAARSHRTKVHEIARRVVEEEQTPAPVVVAIARSSRIRAASMRQVSEIQRERKKDLAGDAPGAERTTRSGAEVERRRGAFSVRPFGSTTSG